MDMINVMVQPKIHNGENKLTFFVENQGRWFELLQARNVDVAAQRQKLRSLMRSHEAGEGNIGTSLENIGSTLYKLVPERLSESLKQTAMASDTPILSIHTTADWIPWELMWDGDDFLGVQYQIARLPVVPMVPFQDSVDPRPVKHILNVLGKDVLSDDTLFNDWVRTFSALVTPNCREVRFPGANGTGADHYPKLSDLRLTEPDYTDILHVTCHGGLEGEGTGQLFWTLYEAATLPDEFRISTTNIEYLCQDLLKLHLCRPLIFGNACLSTESTSTKNAELLSSFGKSFLQMGALGFVGTFAPITKSLAVKFARKFYELLLDQALPIGEALLMTKRHFKDLAGEDPSWLFYCHYGLPNIQFELPDN